MWLGFWIGMGCAALLMVLAACLYFAGCWIDERVRMVRYLQGLEQMRADYEQGERRVPGASKNLPRVIQVE